MELLFQQTDFVLEGCYFLLQQGFVLAEGFFGHGGQLDVVLGQEVAF